MKAYIMFLIVICITVIGCSKDDNVPALQSIKFAEERVELSIGMQQQCKLLVYPSKSEYPLCTWSSSNEKIASVSQDGIITANDIGEAQITATVNTTISASFTVKVIPIHVQSITLDKTQVNALMGDTFSLHCEITPSNATYKKVSWVSTDERKATVNKSGTVYCHEEGSVEIIATTISIQDYTKSVSDTCYINIQYKQPYILYKFENWKNDSPVEIEEDKETMVWATTKEREKFLSLTPAVHLTNLLKHDNYSAVIETIEANDHSRQLGLEVVPGVLFTGNYTLNFNDSNKSFKLGVPFSKKPLRLKGYYNYKRGSGAYIDINGNAITTLKDSCAIYFVCYEVDKYTSTLNVTNLFNHPNVIAVAKFEGTETQTDVFSSFDIPFSYYKNYNREDARLGKYKLAIVIMASKNGLQLEGTPGSKLIVDDIEITIDE